MHATHSAADIKLQNICELRMEIPHSTVLLSRISSPSPPPLLAVTLTLHYCWKPQCAKYYHNQTQSQLALLKIHSVHIGNGIQS